jgi:hypothetical protein
MFRTHYAPLRTQMNRAKEAGKKKRGLTALFINAKGKKGG